LNTASDKARCIHGRKYLSLFHSKFTIEPTVRQFETRNHYFFFTYRLQLETSGKDRKIMLPNDLITSKILTFGLNFQSKIKSFVNFEQIETTSRFLLPHVLSFYFST
jgi:hypothetical protein